MVINDVLISQSCQRPSININNMTVLYINAAATVQSGYIVRDEVFDIHIIFLWDAYVSSRTVYFVRKLISEYYDTA